MRKSTLTDKATGEEIKADADTVERVTGVEKPTARLGLSFFHSSIFRRSASI